MTTKKRLSEIYRKVTDGFNSISSICLFAAMFLIGADVFMRYLFNAPIAGTLEITELVPVIVTYCAFTYTAQQGRHIRTTFLLLRLPGPAVRILNFFSYALMVLFLLLLIWQSALEAMRSWEIKEYSQGLIAVPRYPVKILIPIALSVACFFYAGKIVQLVKGEGMNDRAPEP